MWRFFSKNKKGRGMIVKRAYKFNINDNINNGNKKDKKNCLI
jgi:hypothetical protein